MMRRAACALLIAAIWLLVLGSAAHLRWTAPLLPQQVRGFDASDFQVVMGAGSEDGDSLRVGAVGEDGSALQTVRVRQLQAREFSSLRYRFDGFPRTLELSFVFRRADAPDDVQTVTVPWPGDGWRTLDLKRVPEWHGEISELGFAEYATPQIAPESSAFRPFRFDRAELWSASWRGSFAALYTSWLGYTPWALLSISALGPQREVAQPSPLIPFLVLGAALSLLAAALLLRWSRARLLRNAVVAVAAVWALLDLVWLEDFRAKHQLTESVYAGKSWSERASLVPDQDVREAAEQVRSYLATQPPHQLLVVSDSKYVFLRLIYQMLPLNAVPLEQALGLRWPRRDARFVVYQSEQWHYDEALGALVGGGRAFAVEPVFEAGEVRVYKFRGMP